MMDPSYFLTQLKHASRHNFRVPLLGFHMQQTSSSQMQLLCMDSVVPHYMDFLFMQWCE